MAEERFKSGRTLSEEHRHDNYRKYDRLIKAVLKYEERIEYLKIVFRSKYTADELLETLRDYKGDDPELFLQQRKDNQFREFLMEVSRRECRTAHSCIVVRTHKRFNGKKKNRYKWLYHSLEEYLTEIYNRGDDFVLYVNHLKDVLLKREDEFEYIAPVNPAGEMMIRAMKHEPFRQTEVEQEMYILYTILSNPDLYGNSDVFFKRTYERPVPLPLWHLNKIRRCHYTRYRRYKGEE